MTGPPGSQGKEGPAGVVGPPGPSCVGSPGPQGPRGSTGVQGYRGPQGTKGIKGDTGLKGVRGLIGPRGTEGDDGNPGPPGHPGDRGPKGDRGLPGYKGQPGSQGVPGPELSEDILRKYFEPFKALETQYKKLELPVKSLQDDKRKRQEEMITLRLNNSSSTDRPAAHLYGPSGYMSSSQTITQWVTSTNGNYQSFLRGGMTYSNGYITAPQDGLYYIYVQIAFLPSSSGNAIYFYIRINESNVVRNYFQDHSSNQWHDEQTSFMRFLLKGDRISVYASGSQYYLQAPHGFFGAYKL